MYHSEHVIAEINQITDTMTSAKVGNRSQTPDKDLQNFTNKNHTFWGNCWKCAKFGYSTKECQNNLTMANQDQTHNGPTNVQTVDSVRYPTAITPASTTCTNTTNYGRLPIVIRSMEQIK